MFDLATLLTYLAVMTGLVTLSAPAPLPTSARPPRARPALTDR